MGTEVLYPQDFLAQRLRASSPSFPRRKAHHHRPPTNSNTTRSTRRRKEAARAPAPVTILRREEVMEDLTIFGTGRLGPEAAAVPKLYAGSGFAVSPAPSALPMPSFSKRDEPGVNHTATKDLLRILRLE